MFSMPDNPNTPQLLIKVRGRTLQANAASTAITGMARRDIRKTGNRGLSPSNNTLLLFGLLLGKNYSGS